MKHTQQIKRKSVATMQRDHDLTLAFGRVRNRNRGKGLTFQRLVEQTLEGPAPCYYVDPEYALRVLSRLRRGGKVTGPALRRQMWEELHRRALAVMERYGLERYSDGVYRVLWAGGASRFFISQSTAEQVLREVRSDKANRANRADRTDREFK